ncbi:MAG: Phosphoribosylformylglycinamidine synthase, glutamine amidotransferase subunit (EC 6.3.5.3) [Olavius algarvensis Delta 4 endosymbiont]|nr:MAG: Phosphoribosylformylglycinamidine synthase, glutamine amidotransferase subunit (EC 6.3.5.3) [Olavius algarvensis Delta 4 endosymbiont]
MSNVQALVLAGYGQNCDHETAYALELAGATAQRVHINALIDGSVRLDGFQIVVFGGGFSWGDDHGAGVVQAVRMKTHLGDQLLAYIAGGNLVLGICNGFQCLVNLGLLPGIAGDYSSRKVALIGNDCGQFRDQWVNLAVNSDSPCVFTRGLDQFELPVRHGEGKFYAEAAVVDQLVADQQVVVRYAAPDGRPADGAYPLNPNGSLLDIAGICDSTGRIFGLMPHPEAYNHPTNHPDFTRLKARGRADNGPTPGIQMFINAVGYFN